MSEEKPKAFVANVKAEDSLEEQPKAEGADVTAIPKAAGFATTKEDLKAHLPVLSSRELSLNTLTNCKNIF